MAIHNPVTSYGVNSSGDSEAPLVTDGSTHVADGVINSGHNRLIPAAAATHPGDDTNNASSWSEAEGVTKLIITPTIVTPTATINADDDLFCLVTIDAPNGATALSFLSVAAFSISTDAVVYKIPLGVRTELPFITSSPIRRVDVQPTAICHILVEAL